MKKYFIIFFVVLCGIKSYTQNEDYPHVISVQTGASLFTPFRGSLKGSTEAADTLVSFSSANIHKHPQINISYDYALKTWFSIGGSASYNHIVADLQNVQYNKAENLGSFSLGITRLTFGARALFHYANTDRIDVYSGVRLGFGIWTANAGASAASSLDGKIGIVAKEVGGGGLWRTVLGSKIRGSFVMPQVQLILFGMRGYITEHIGINGELSVGSPYFASIGINYRFGAD